MKNPTPDLIEKVKTADSAEELLEIAKANGVEMTPDEAIAYFEQINAKNLDDDLLDGVAGGILIGGSGNENDHETRSGFGISSRKRC